MKNFLRILCIHLPASLKIISREDEQKRVEFHVEMYAAFSIQLRSWRRILCDEGTQNNCANRHLQHASGGEKFHYLCNKLSAATFHVIS